MAEAARLCWRPSSPTSMLLQQVAQGCIQVSFEYLQECHSFSRYSVFDQYPHSKKVSSYDLMNCWEFSLKEDIQHM